MYHSEAVLRALGAEPQQAADPQAAVIGVPVVDVVEDPNGAAFQLVEDLEEAMLGPGPSSRRRRRAGSLSRMPHSGLVTLEDRRCCVELLLGENGRQHLRRLPYEVTCPDCERTFRVRMGVRTVGQPRGR